jgi:hypothetical protein
MVKSNCHAKENAILGSLTALFSERKKGAFEDLAACIFKPVAALSQSG